MKYSNASKFLCAKCFYHIIGQLAQEALSTQPLPWCLLRIISGAWKTTFLFGTFVSFAGAAKLKTWGSIWIPPIGFTTNFQSTLSRSWLFQFSLLWIDHEIPNQQGSKHQALTVGVWRNHEYQIQQNVRMSNKNETVREHVGATTLRHRICFNGDPYYHLLSIFLKLTCVNKVRNNHRPPIHHALKLPTVHTGLCDEVVRCCVLRWLKNWWC